MAACYNYSVELHDICNTSYQANVHVMHMSESCQLATSSVSVSVCMYLLTCSCSRLFAEETELNECCTAEVRVFSKCVGKVLLAGNCEEGLGGLGGWVTPSVLV